MFCLPKDSLVFSERGMFLLYENPFLTKSDGALSQKLT